MQTGQGECGGTPAPLPCLHDPAYHGRTCPSYRDSGLREQEKRSEFAEKHVTARRQTCRCTQINLSIYATKTCRYTAQKLFSRRGNIFSRRGNILSRRGNIFSRRDNSFYIRSDRFLLAQSENPVA